MKILPVDKIREADAYTIANEPITDIDLMERASMACFYRLIEIIRPGQRVLVMAGPGNNGGDGLAIARLLRQKGIAVIVFLFADPEKLSPSCRINFDRYKALPETEILRADDFHPVSDDVIIDALYGSGITRAIEGIQASAIRTANTSGALIVAIDIPSGLFCDGSVKGLKDPAIIRANHTLTFAPPKLAFFLPENEEFAGNWELLDIGIMKEFIDSAVTKNFYTDPSDLRKIFRPRRKFSHKGSYGHALLICGGKGKIGAAVLTARACIRAGAGLTTVRIPGCGQAAIQSAVPEAMTDIDQQEDYIASVIDVTRYNAVGIGPGIGNHPETAKALKLLIQQAGKPLVIDADAINLLGENKTWLSFLPPGSVFTPHPKEFERLAGKSTDNFDRLKIQREFSFRYQCYVVLKGAHTSITTPDGDCTFNTTGNPGMAKGGSGDALTGIITGLLAQHYTPREASVFGVYLHGLAGDIAAEETGIEAMTASDLIRNMGNAFKTFYGEF